MNIIEIMEITGKMTNKERYDYHLMEMLKYRGKGPEFKDYVKFHGKEALKANIYLEDD